jgi:hypothetical protein
MTVPQSTVHDREAILEVGVTVSMGLRDGAKPFDATDSEFDDDKTTLQKQKYRHWNEETGWFLKSLQPADLEIQELSAHGQPTHLELQRDDMFFNTSNTVDITGKQGGENDPLSFSTLFVRPEVATCRKTT